MELQQIKDNYKLIIADAQHLPLENESVDCIVTSPPYWGLRDYGEDVSTWWDGDKDCEHEREEIIKPKERGSYGKSSWHRPGRDREAKWKPQISSFCSKCGAWYGQLGLEPTIELYLKHMGYCLAEMYRVLKKTGALFLNIGDTYSGSQMGYGQKGESTGFQNVQRMDYYPTAKQKSLQSQIKNIPRKSLCLIPDRLRIMMVEAGWIIRNKVIWNKPNTMPSSDKDSFTPSYEDVIFATKNNKPLWWWNEKTGEMVYKRSKRYEENRDWRWVEHTACKGTGWIVKDGKKQQCSRCKGTGKIKRSYWHGEDYSFDLDAVRKPHSESTYKRQEYALRTQEKIRVDHKKSGYPGQDYNRPGRDKIGPKLNSESGDFEVGKNPGDVWTISTQPYPDTHYATFPEKLVKECLLAGCPKEICVKCGMARVRITKPSEEYAKKLGRDWGDHKIKYDQRVKKINKSCNAEYQTIGWSDCGCGEGFRPGVVLDPFAGSGTVAKVALEMGLDVILVELKEEYVEKHCKKRIQGTKIPLNI